MSTIPSINIVPVALRPPRLTQTVVQLTEGRCMVQTLEGVQSLEGDWLVDNNAYGTSTGKMNDGKSRFSVLPSYFGRISLAHCIQADQTKSKSTVSIGKTGLMIKGKGVFIPRGLQVMHSQLVNEILSALRPARHIRQ